MREKKFENEKLLCFFKNWTSNVNLCDVRMSFIVKWSHGTTFGTRENGKYITKCTETYTHTETLTRTYTIASSTYSEWKLGEKSASKLDQREYCRIFENAIRIRTHTKSTRDENQHAEVFFFQADIVRVEIRTQHYHWNVVFAHFSCLYFMLSPLIEYALSLALCRSLSW